MLCVEFPQVQHIDLSELIHVLKAVAIVTSALNELINEWSVTFLIAKVSPEWRLNLGVGAPKKCPFPLNRDVSSQEVTNTKTL